VKLVVSSDLMVTREVCWTGDWDPLSFHHPSRATWTLRADLMSVSLALTQLTIQAMDTRGRCLFIPQLSCTYCAYPRRDGQAELIWVASYELT